MAVDVVVVLLYPEDDGKEGRKPSTTTILEIINPPP
jgi:hypothetical protein